MFRCKKIRRIKDIKGRREWVKEKNEMGQLGSVGVSEVGENGGHWSGG